MSMLIDVCVNSHIPDDSKGEIFDTFFSCSNSDANLGMGLTIVKSIIDAHGGTIQLSNCNQQVTFIRLARFMHK